MTRKEATRQTIQTNQLRALGFTREECENLRRISRTLQRWFERECGDSNNYMSWAITRGRMVDGVFTHDDDGQAFEERHVYVQNRIGQARTTYTRIADRETGARRRLAAILQQRNLRQTVACDCGYRLGDETGHEADCAAGQETAISAYIQTDPRGAALYLLQPGDIPGGQTAEGCYTRGICVY